jgi:hypothetical protein
VEPYESLRRSIRVWKFGAARGTELNSKLIGMPEKVTSLGKIANDASNCDKLGKTPNAEASFVRGVDMAVPDF